MNKFKTRSVRETNCQKKDNPVSFALIIDKRKLNLGRSNNNDNKADKTLIVYFTQVNSVIFSFSQT